MIGQEIFEKLKARFKREDKFRILFCPYKEDMFDCMRTIYLSAKEDEETVTDVMPIPYFLLEAGLPKRIEMEFPWCNNFPDALNDGWDCIVIHNQYDQFNSVTRLLLTSLMLKQFCNNLVFIGYAVVGDRDIEPQEVHLPMFKNVDLVICENNRHAYQTEMYMREQGWSGKAVGWGNPKFDNVDTEIPDSVKDKINGREVIFLQTSLVPFMQNPNAKLKQIEGIIDKYFYNDSVCIWWRPHPLLEHTIKSQYPPVYKQFVNLKKRIDESRHIYDTSSDNHTCINIADRMISDKSSMVVMFEKTGKPIEMMEEL